MKVDIDPSEYHDDVVASAAQRLFHQYHDDDDVATMVQERFVKIVEEKCLAVVDPIIKKGIGELIVAKTNEYGEKKGEPKTLTEFIIGFAEGYLMAEVDFEGDNPRYSSSAQTRLCYLVNKELRFTIEKAVSDAVLKVNKMIAPAIAKTVEIQIAKAVAAIREKP